MTYIRPQNRIFQTSRIQPTLNTSPRRAVVLAPVAKLVRFNVASEQALGRLGFYDGLLEQTFSWPAKPVGSKVDLDYTKIYMKDALLKYFSDSSAGGYNLVTDLDRGPNVLYSSNLSFKDNTSTYPRTAAAFYDRDVQIGDVVKVRAVNNVSEPITLWTTVKKISGVVVAAVTSAAAEFAANANTTVAGAVETFVAGPENCVFITGDASLYDGFTDGFMTDTYTVIVTGSSSGGDYTTATLRIISASGLDDVEEFVPAADGVAKAAGTRGLTIQFDYTTGVPCAAAAVTNDVTEDDLIVGQTWTIAVTGALTATVATSSGTYTGTQDATYIVEVTRGGTFAGADKPQFTVSSDIGFDQSGPTNVSAAATPYPVGSFGVLVAFSGTRLRKGDKFTIPVTAAGVGAMRFLELTHNLDETIDDATAVDLDLFIKVPVLEIPENRTWSAPDVSWSTTQTELTIVEGLTATEASWTDNGDLMRMDVVSEESKNYGILFAEARYWRSDISGSIRSISDSGNLAADIGGDDSNDNPLYRGVRYGLLNGGAGQTLLYGAISDPDDINSWAETLALLIHRTDVGAIAACSNNKLVHDLVTAHCVSMGSPENKKFRRVFKPSFATPKIPIVHAGSDVVGHTLATTGDGEVALCTIGDDPGTGGTQYTRVICPASNANFITNGVRVGDTYRTAYGTDGFGGTTFSEYLIADVVSEDELLLESGPSVAAPTAIKGEVWRTTNAAEEAAEFAAQAGSDSSELITMIVPDSFEAGAESVPSYFAACAHMALAYGVLPNQGLTNVEILGFSSVQRITQRFSDTDLDTIAASGGCIITQDPQTGRIFIRHAVTTGDTNNISVREEMMVRNKFDILYAFADIFEPFLGRTNTTDRLISRIEDLANNVIRMKLEIIVNPDLGPQLQSLDEPIVVERNAVNQDRIDFYAKMTGVAPNNGIDSYLTF